MPKTKQHLDFHEAFREDVLSGRKTQTRRVIKHRRELVADWTGPLSECLFVGRVKLFEGASRSIGAQFIAPCGNEFYIECPYKVGEIVSTPFGDARITDIRAERLQDISEDDCDAEGIDFVFDAEGHDLYVSHIDKPQEPWACGADAFANLWRSIYPEGPKSWESNPAVWAITFEMIGGNDE